MQESKIAPPRLVQESKSAPLMVTRQPGEEEEEEDREEEVEEEAAGREPGILTQMRRRWRFWKTLPSALRVLHQCRACYSSSLLRSLALKPRYGEERSREMRYLLLSSPYLVWKGEE